MSSTKSRSNNQIDKALVFKSLCTSLGMPQPVTEHKFHSERKFRFDFAWPNKMIALEVEGGIFGRGEKCPACGRREVGAHSSIKDMLKDMEKYNLAAQCGWRVFRCQPGTLLKVETAELIKSVL